ncbi:50S ribosomal protein L10 [Patescibacteria group bacterium]|nr:50S ribosomal protein L10 [Patescibacteria group bacterium]
MALTKDQKKKAVEDLKKRIENKKSIVFVDFSKVNSKDIFSFRQKLKAAGCTLKVSKKTLWGIAFEGANAVIWEEAKKNIPGQLAIVFGIEDEVSPAKISAQFSKESENLKILGGIFENKYANKEMILTLSRIPSRDELLAKLVGSIASPVSGFVNVLQGNIKGLLYALSAIKK